MILAEKFVNIRPVSNATFKRHFSVRWASVYVFYESGVVQERPRCWLLGTATGPICKRRGNASTAWRWYSVLSASPTLRRTSSMVTDWSHKLATLTITCWIGKAVRACLISAAKVGCTIVDNETAATAACRMRARHGFRTPFAYFLLRLMLKFGALVRKTDFWWKYSVEKRQAENCGFPPHGQSRTPSFFHGIFSEFVG